MNERKIQLFHVLNQLYIKESSLTCVKCHNWLHREIYSHSDDKVYCTSCVPEETDRRRNDILEDCLRDVLFPCKYVECDFILKRDQVADHESICLNGSTHGYVNCTLCNSNNMNETKFIEHLKTVHTDIVTSLVLNRPTFSVAFDEATKSVFYIVTFYHHNFLVLIQRNESKFCVDVAKVKDANVNHERNSNFTISFSSGDKQYSYNKPFIYCSKLYINENNVDMYVKDQESLDIEVKLYDSTNCMDMPKCPICLFEFAIEVFQCANGHNVCNACGKITNSCAICQSTTLRTVTLNQLFSNALMQCQNIAKGCMAVVKYVDISAHATECSYNNVECLYCGAEYLQYNCISHFKQNHKLRLNFEIFYKPFQNYLSSFNCYVLFKKRIFLFKCEITDRKICYAVQLLHCANIKKAQDYTFQVHILGFGDSQFTKLILRGLCQTTSDNNYSVSMYYSTCARYFVKEDDDQWTFIFRYGIIEVGDALDAL